MEGPGGDPRAVIHFDVREMFPYPASGALTLFTIVGGDHELHAIADSDFPLIVGHDQSSSC
jgi:hypothetical protein